MRAISSSSSVEKAHILVACHHLQADELNCSITMRSFLFFIFWRCPYSRGFAPLTEGGITGMCDTQLTEQLKNSMKITCSILWSSET